MPDGRTERLSWIFVALGVVSGFALYLDLRAIDVELPGGTGPGLVPSALAMGALFAAFLLVVRRGVRGLVRRALGDRPGAFARYRARETWAYAPLLLLFGGAAGARLSVPFTYVVFLASAAAHVLAALRALSVHRDANQAPFFESNAWLAILFLVSGMAALVYEVVWQRVLFSVYGVNIESVTIIVAIFMFGLGLGALVGGAASRRFPDHVPAIFAACEVGIGLFGAVSVPLIDAVGSRTLQLPLAGVAATIFALLLVPVVLMGATLPLLVQHLTRHDPNVGAALGRLYSLNTLGAALASLVTVDVLFVLLGRQATIFVAIALNALVAALVFRFAVRLKRRVAVESGLAGGSTATGERSETSPTTRESLPRPMVLALSFVVGFVSLSQEIVWMRPMGYATQGAPQVFGQVLGVFLVGVAAGAWKAKKLCDAGIPHPTRRLGRNLVAAGGIYFLAFPIFAGAMTFSRGLGIPVAFILVGTIAYLMGLVLPLLVQLDAGSSREASGSGVAYVYFANVAGATAGPLFTGFVLLGRLTFEQCAVVVSAATIAVGLFLLAWGTARISWSRRTAAGAILAVAAVFLHGPLYRNLPERLRDGPTYAPERAFVHVVQNRSGILAVRRGPDGDVMYGGGIYDGGFNVGLVKNSNEISRAYLTASLHRRARNVLMIGLSTGSWTWVVAQHSVVEHIDVVEINPGYAAIVQEYPLQRQILDDPKIAIHYDDGRRWLKRNPDVRFDAIVMNATYHWRSNMTNLLSREFMELCKVHLEKGGYLYFNATRDPDAARTAAAVFEHVTTYHTFVAASDAPFDMTFDERRAALLAFRRAGRSIIEDEGPAGIDALDRLARVDLTDHAAEYRARVDLQIITDDNMLPEFKRIFADSAIGVLYQWRGPARSWESLLSAR